MVLVAGCFALGWLARRLLPRPAGVAAVLDGFVLTVALPALILVKLPDVALSGALVPAAVAWGGLAVAALVVGVVARRWSPATRGALLLVTPLGNTSFLGLAAVEGLLGTRFLGPALAFDQLGSFLGLTTYGSVVAGGGFEWRRLLRFAPFLALLASIPLRWVELPEAAHDVLAGIGRTVAPLAMLALGLRFRLRIGRHVLGPVTLALATKLLLVPALALGVATVLGVADRTAWQASILQAGMPPMVTAGLVATRAGFDEEVATTAIGIGLLVSFVTLPLLAAVL